MKAHYLLAIVAVFVSACMPLRQHRVIKGGSDSDLLLCDDRYLLVQIGSSNEPNSNKIIPKETFIYSPRGERYTVEVESHQFDIEQKYPCIRERIYPIDAKGKRLRHWSNGIWKVHLTFATLNGHNTRDEEIKFWTFWYNPIIHGPPN